MQSGDTVFATSVFTVDVHGLEPHPNPVICIVMGLRGPVAVHTLRERVEGDVLIIRSGVEHRISCEGGLRAMYMDGLAWSGDTVVAKRLEGRLAELADMGARSNAVAQSELRERLSRSGARAKDLRDVVRELAVDPMRRMNQAELSRLLGMERTAALKLFKAETGMTFRQFKRWTGLKHAAGRIVAGELVRTAALDGGFADAAHLTRTFRASFGLTPSEAIAGLRRLRT